METGAAIVAVACPGCTSMLEAVPGPRPEVRDVAELLWQSLDNAA
jgi:Fe-S oxidoreductase